jgi:competence protein ComEC
MKILQFPLTKISIAFIFGLLFFQYYIPSPIIVFGSLLVCISTIILFHFSHQNKRIIRPLFGVFILLTSFLIGISTAVFHKETFNKIHYTNQIKNYETPHLLVVTVNEKVKKTQKNIRFIASLQKLDNRKSFGKIILNIRKPNNIDTLKIGTRLKVIGTIYKNKGAFNPNQFDYGKYLEKQEIYAQVYTDKKQVKVIGTESTVWSRFSNFRSKIIKKLELSNFKNDELNILIALLLGQQQDISPEILKDYQYAGAVHVLSVSGLHVGFILLFITFILKPLSNSRRNSFLKLIIILASLWTFGILAGLSASVVRSVVMFSFVAIGNNIRRTVNIYHTLLVSILLILLWRPSFLFDIGFQLSYLALFF